MNNKKIAKELVKIAKELVGSNIKRTAYLSEDHPALYWEFDAQRHSTKQGGLKYIEEVASKDIKKLGKLIKFYEDEFNINTVYKFDELKRFEASVYLQSFDDEKLVKELKRMRFRIK